MQTWLRTWLQAVESGHIYDPLKTRGDGDVIPTRMFTSPPFTKDKKKSLKCETPFCICEIVCINHMNICQERCTSYSLTPVSAIKAVVKPCSRLTLFGSYLVPYSHAAYKSNGVFRSFFFWREILRFFFIFISRYPDLRVFRVFSIIGFRSLIKNVYWNTGIQRRSKYRNIIIPRSVFLNEWL